MTETDEITQTAIIYNKQPKNLGLPEYYYRRRIVIDTNTQMKQYAKLKLMQNTVRVPSSLYTSNIGSLNTQNNNIMWNQMSDRPMASVQKASVPTGVNCALNRKHTSVTSSRPGCQTPGGVGCDIKHNSYDRYLNRLKGNSMLKRQPIPSDLGTPIPFNLGYPVYGGKTMKTNIVEGCVC